MSLLGLGGQVLLGELGNLLAGKSDAEADAILRSVYEKYGQLQGPELEKAVAQEVQSSQSTDPQLKEAQFNALNKMKSMEEGGGFNLESQAGLNRALGESAQAEQRGRRAILEGMASRGTSGSGAELAMQLDNQSQAANRARDTGLDVAAQAQRNYLESIKGRAGLAGNMRGQDLGEQQARDEIAKFNAMSRERATQQRNAAAQQQYDNQVGVLDRQAGVAGTQEKRARERAAATRNRFAAYGQGNAELWKPKAG